MPKKKDKKNVISRAESRAAYGFLFPSLIGLSLVTYIPLIAVFVLSFFKWNGLSDPEFNGIANYVRLFTKDPYLFDSIKATIYFAVVAVIGSVIWSLIVAILLNRKVPARGFFRAVFYLPYVLPAMAVYLGWGWLYDYNHGLFNYIITSLGGERIMFLENPAVVVPSLALITIWLSGNLIVIFLAGLQNVPRIYYEAAEIDGASSWQRFWNITLPCMTPIIFYNMLMSLVSSLQVFVPSFSLTSGGPGNSTTFLSYLIYRYAFTGSGKLGYASAIAAIFFVIIGLFTTILFATSKFWVFYMGGDDK